jgi:hypothetical protein
MSPRYHYLPWVREGAAHAFTNTDSLAAVLEKPSGDRKLSTLPVGLSVNERAPLTVPVRVFGPGDVVGIDPRGVLRTDPLARTADFEPNYLACIEFDTPDFPWLFTPAAAGQNGRLRPWLVLVVVRHREEVKLSSNRGLPLPQLETPVAELPDLIESWAWAHAQVVQMDATQPVDKLLTEQPSQNLSRLLSPRRLEPETSYLACVVPAFEAGRKAGRGEDVGPADEDKLAPAWDGSKPFVTLPVYYTWEFATGTGGDFETLARRLRPQPVAANVGRRPLRVGRQPFGLPDGGVLQLEGALVAPGPFTRPAPTNAFRTELRKLVNLGAEPVVAPPVYGRWQSARDAVPTDAGEPAWLRDLNLDPSARAVAGLGVVVVQRDQEELVAAAWNQLGDPTAVRAVERRLEVAVAVLGSVVRRRLEPMEPGRLVQFLGPASTRMLTSPRTLHAALSSQGLPASFSAPAFRRAVKPVAPSKVGFPRAPLPFQAIATRLGTALPVLGLPGGSTGAVTGAVMVETVAKVPRTNIAAHLRYRAAAAALRDYAAAFSQRAIESRVQFGFTAEFKASLVAGLDPRQTAAPRFYARVSAAAGTVEPPPAPGESVLFAPSFPQPMYESLRDLSPELLLPGVGTIDLDTVTLLNSNPRFIEAYMVGLNHELAGELLWREFPSDTRATYFRQFWDTRGIAAPMPQLASISTWSAAAGLGGNFGAGAHVVLLIRGELLHRYPDALIYAVRAKTTKALGTEEKLPLFRGRIDPDITFLGFDLTEAAARGTAADPGWFFVIQEQPTAPRFGMDETRAPETPLDTWNDLAWSDVATPPGAHLTIGAISPAVASPGNVAWAFNAAHMAAVLRQRPVRIAIHARRLLSGEPPSEPTPPGPRGPRTRVPTTGTVAPR